jgi:hypothetical protein
MIQPNKFQQLPIGDNRFQLFLNGSCCARLELNSSIYCASRTGMSIYDYKDFNVGQIPLFDVKRKQIPVTLREQI